MTTTVTIGVGEKIWETLTPDDYAALLAWFERNGIDPNEIRNDRLVTIANGVIDCWATNPVAPAGSRIIEATWTVGDLPDVHLEAPVIEDMEPGLAERVHALWLARVEKYAAIAAQVAGAHAAAEAADKVRKDAGLD
jgi:hypothetical protein